MLTVRLQIADEDILDSYKGWGLIYIQADKRFSAPVKKMESSSYPEDPGEHIDPRTVANSFDYTVTFAISGKNRNLTNVNTKIAAFNKALYTRDGQIRIYNRVTIYNDRDRVKITGIPEPIAEADEFYRRKDGSIADYAVVKFKIRVDNPEICDFDLKIDEA